MFVGQLKKSQSSYTDDVFYLPTNPSPQQKSAKGFLSGFQLLRAQIINCRKQMNIINAGVPLGITYAINPTLYLNGQSVIYPASFISPQVPSKREINLETSFKILQQKYQALLQENQDLKNKLQQCDKKAQGTTNKRSFVRRTEDELDKKFKCFFDNCKKEYASTLALNLHIKNKHRGGTKKQMEQQAKKIIEAELKGQEPPIQAFKLPQGFLEKFRREYMAAPSTTEDLLSLQQ